MRFHYLLTALLILFTLNSISQNISVKSFNELTSDVEARLNPVIDQNGDKCALIKMVTIQKGFRFEGDMNGITKTKNKIGEIWIYLPFGSKKITIKHEKLGVLRNYIYPLAIKEATVYEMVLTTAKVTTIVEEYEVPTQWLVITSKPNGADVYINDQHKGQTPWQMEMEEGKYVFF